MIDQKSYIIILQAVRMFSASYFHNVSESWFAKIWLLMDQSIQNYKDICDRACKNRERDYVDI